MNNPARYAESMRTAYQTYLEGRGGIPARSVTSRLQPDSAGESTLAGMRGPYLQALPIANWSDTDWETFAHSQGLHPNVVRAFTEEGFSRLYDFQERSVETILAGDDTVITAATGRGKTEAWLIPILDQIVTAKRDEQNYGRTSTKALLLYPTKALAQDQFKRLVQILYRINRNLRQKEWVTIGIYDGDTPRNIYESKAQGYLNRTFQHFGCPGANDELEKCQNCRQGVFVERSTDDYRLRPDKRRCEDDEAHRVPLNFVRLTKHAVLEEGADIILTNPDTLNYRLLNINAEAEQDVFVYDPSYVVFDEVHTYDGLLGSYTATLVKRLRRLRERQECDPLQVIGSSATVDNDADLFRQISGATDISRVPEHPRTLAESIPRFVPEALTADLVQSEDLVAAGWPGQPTPPQAGDIDLTVDDADSLDNDRVEEKVSDALYEFLTTLDPRDPVVQTIQTMHTELKDAPRPPQTFVADCETRFELSTSEAETLVDNFQRLGQFAGMLESRNHLFSWPLDGFYACASCTAVYRSPQEQCAACDGNFVSRATYCRQCDDEYLVAHACSRCAQLQPYVHTEEGLLGEDEHQHCPVCDTQEDVSVPMHRVIFRPRYRCTACGSLEDRSVTGTCPDCHTPGVPRGSTEFICRNPACEREWQASLSCSACSSDSFELAAEPREVHCWDCNRVHGSDSLPVTCACGSRVVNTRLLPWVCSNDTCDAAHFEAEPPRACSCGSTEFAKGALAELAVQLTCADCSTGIVPGGDCGCDDSEYRVEERPFRRYRSWRPNGTIVSPLEHRNAIPCSHHLYSTVVGDAFTELQRSPTNAAVTTSQYLLRGLVDESGFEAGKLLSFSDSHRDMKELDRSFTDPEIGTVLDQLILVALTMERAGIEPEELSPAALQSLRPGSDFNMIEDPAELTPWVSLDAIVDTAFRVLETLEAELGGGDVRDSMSIDLVAVILGTTHLSNPTVAVKDRIRRRAVRHVGERRRSGGVSLERDGLIDVRLAPQVTSGLLDSEQELLAALVDAGNNVLRDDLVGESTSLEGAAMRLIQNGVLVERGGNRVALSPSMVEVTHPESGDVGYHPGDDEYYSSLQRWRDTTQGIVDCDDSIRARADRTHPRFTDRAFTATWSRVAMLLSRLYYGSTPKMERREIEHRFRSEPSPNFLSSGPTMELGVDIGSLDALLMYGTPPNMNAYLQRVGRAGRASHSSLVHSVSQRNPIDYYYYDEPTELITAEKQPVPLNEHNERVLEISLTWAVFDYLAATFVIPWEVSRHDVTGGENVVRRSEAMMEERAAASKFTYLLGRPVSTLDLGEESSRLRPLGILIDDETPEIRDHLESLLDYAFCPSCHRRYDRSRAPDQCPESECSRALIDAQEAYRECIDAAIENVSSVFVDGYRNYRSRINTRIEALEERRETHEQEVADSDDADVQGRHERAIAQIDARMQVLRDHLEDLERETYGDILGETFAEFAFNLRSVSDTVDISVVDETGEPSSIGDDRGGRSSRLALGELHPGAAYLHERRPFVVSQVFTDDKASTDLRERVEASGDESATRLAGEFVCIDCGDTTTTPESSCECGTRRWQECRLYAMDSVEAILDTEPLPNELDTASEIYEQPSKRVQNTFSRRHTEILEFEATEQFELISDSGTVLGRLEYGAYEILDYTGSFRAKYQQGGIDPDETRFQVCTEPDCPGIIYSDSRDIRRCTVSPDHEPETSESSAAFARFGYQYSTEGVRVTLPEAGGKAAHTFGHGLRLALQKLSGVPIRDVSEHVDGDHVDVFDAQEGGAAVARQLIQERQGEFRNFATAIDMIETQFTCDCSDGCPRCVYQYGCAERNKPRSFDIDTIRDVVIDDSVRLRRSDTGN